MDPRIVDEVQRLLVGRCGRRGCAEGGGAIAGPLVGLGRPPAQLLGVDGSGVGVEGLAEVLGDHLGHLGSAVRVRDLEVVGDRDVTVLALPAGQVVVDDRPHESLCELELASFRRQRVSDDGEDLPPHQAGEEVVELAPGRLGDRVDGGAREAGAEHGEVTHERALLRGEAVEAGHQEGGEGGRHLEVVERAHEAGPGAVGLHQARGRRAIGRSRRRRAGSPRPGRRCARPRSAGAGRRGRRGAGASTRSSSGSRPMLVPLRRCPHPGRRSASSGRARVRMKMGWADDQSRIDVEEVEQTRRRPTAGRRSP